MLKKSLAIILSTALALGILVQGSFAYVFPSGITTLDDIFGGLHTFYPTVSVEDLSDHIAEQITPDSEVFVGITHYGAPRVDIVSIIVTEDSDLCFHNGWYCSKPSSYVYFTKYAGSSGYQSGTGPYLSSSVGTTFQDLLGTWYSVGIGGLDLRNADDPLYSSEDIYYFDHVYSRNLDLGSYNPDTRYLAAYMSGSTYGNVRFLAVQTDDVVLSSTWLSIRYHDQYGPGTYIKDYPFDFTSSEGYSIIRINPEEISHSEFTVDSVLYSGSSSWGVKEVADLNITFNEDILPSPIPSAYPVPDYSYYDTTYINYNGGNPEIIYTPISSELTIGFLGSDISKYYFLDEFPFLYLEQPFSYSFIVIPDIQFEYSSFLGDCIYQYDVVIDDFEITNNNYSQTYSFDYVYGSGAWSNLNGLLSAAQVTDVSSILESWYASHDPIVYQFPYHTNEAFSFDDRVYDCSLIITDSFYFKQTNYLLGDTGDVLSEFSERFFKIDGFSDSLFDNISSLYNLNLQYYDSSLDALTGLSYWLNDNDISSNLSDITNLLSSLDSYLSSVDGKLNYLVTIDSDLNDLLEWFQNQEDSDVTLTLPDFNPTILIDYYGENIGDFVEFVQDFVDTLPSFDYSDFPNFFDYAADLVDDTAGQSDDLIGSLFQPYDYDDSGLHEFGWD